MNLPFLYVACVLIWGSTWLAITFQLGEVPVTASLTYRFALASLILFVWCAARRIPLRFSRQQHGFIALQGVSLFGINYWLIYLAEQHLPSGIVAVAFTAVVMMNLIGSRIAFGTPLTARALAGAALGLLGIALVFWPELLAFRGDRTAWLGLVYSLAAAAFASVGNLLSARNQKDAIGVIPGNALGMGYGAAFMALAGVVTGSRFSFDPTLPYTASLIYLAVFGSVLAFGAYLTLIGRLGAARASYAGVLIPLVALVFSTFLEGYTWHPAALLGVLTCIAGNLLIQGKPAAKPAPVQSRLEPALAERR